jgi:hypothetical protein
MTSSKKRYLRAISPASLDVLVGSLQNNFIFLIVINLYTPIPLGPWLDGMSSAIQFRASALSSVVPLASRSRTVFGDDLACFPPGPLSLAILGQIHGSVGIVVVVRCCFVFVS